MTTVHCIPVNDLVEHDTTGEHDCACGPDTEHVPNPDRPDGWLVTHHSLDGRERSEQIGKPGGNE
jgi:hypothetical protein